MMRRVSLVLLASSLVTLQTPICEAFIFDFMGNVINLKDFLGIGLDLIRSIQPGTEIVENEKDKDELLELISQNINDMKDNLKGNFTAIFGKIDQLKSDISVANIEESFDNIIDKIGHAFNSLVKKQFKTNKDISWISNSEAIIVANYEIDLEENWQRLHSSVYEKMLDHLKKEISNDVCETGISHFQLLERSLNQYMTVANQYLFSQHIIYNIREYIDKQSKHGDRQEFNYHLQRDLENDVNKIKKAMGKSSTEYWLCDSVQSINKANFMPAMELEKEQSSSNCELLQENGYQCIPFDNYRHCDCIKSTIVISTALAQADPGYVIIGAQMMIDGSVLIMAATQAKLLPSGEIDKKTIRPVTNKKSGGYEDFIIKKSAMEFGKVEIPQGRYMTAVGFRKSTRPDSFFIGAESMKYDFKTKQLITSDIRSEPFRFSGKVTKFIRAVDIEKGPNGQKNIYWTNRIYPLIDNRLVQSSDPEPLSGISLFLRGKSEDGGFVAFKINTYNTVPLIPNIPSLNELPIQKMLKSLSSAIMLHDLESQFGKL